MSRSLLAPVRVGGPAILGAANLVSPPGEIAFVDTSVADLAGLLAGLDPEVEVVMLDSAGDALAQIAAALAGRNSVSAIHIIANGGEGSIDFGAGSVRLADLAAHAADLAVIGEALSGDGDILLWSCDTGAGAPGQAFVDALAQATGADVAASTGPTGAAARGGDWTLELRSGAIEAGVPLTGAGIDSYDGLLDDEPNGTDATLTAQEDTDYVFAAADFGFDDGVENNNLVAVTITTLPGAGAIYLLDGFGGETEVIGGQSIPAADIDAGLLVYRPGADGNGPGYTDFTFQVQDDGGSNDIDTTPNTITFDVEAVNDTPTIAFTAYEAAPGGEVQVNSYTADDQMAPMVARLPNGGHIVVWMSLGQDGSVAGVYMQRYDASGAPDGGETSFNPGLGGIQGNPDVAALADGGIAVVWQALDGDNFGIVMQRFDASGAPIGSATAVNSYTSDSQDAPRIGALADGGYVVVWVSGEQDGDGSGIYMQRFDAAGAPAGAETQVNATAAGNQDDPAIAGLADGGFVVTWEVEEDIYMQRFDASGAPVGGETMVNTTTDDQQDQATVAALADGGYIVVWSSMGQDGGDLGIFAQRYDASGAAVGGETQINSYTNDNQRRPAVVGLPDGGYVIAWDSFGQDGDERGIYARRFDAGGNPDGEEQQVNSETADAQWIPAIAAVGNGYVIAWQSEAQDGDGLGIYSQRFDANFAATEGVALELKNVVAFDDLDNSGQTYTVTLSVDYGMIDISAGFTGVSINAADPMNIVITGILYDIQALFGSEPFSFVNFVTSDDAPPAGATLSVTISDGTDITSGTIFIPITPVNDAPYLDLDFTDSTASGFDSAAAWQDGDAPVALAYAVELDDDNDGFDGATVTAAFTANGTADDRLTIISVGDGLGEIRVDGSDLYYEGTLVGSIAGGTDGSTPLVVTFNEDACHCAVQLTIASIAFSNVGAAPDETDRTVTITLVDGGGTAYGGFDTASADVTISVSGGNDAPTVEFALPGVPLPVGGEFTVNQASAGNQGSPSIAAFEDGSYIVVWLTDEGGDMCVRGQFFLADGTAIGDEFRVNTIDDAQLRAPAVAVLDDGGFVVTWENWNADTTAESTIQAQRFDSAGNPVDGEFQVSSVAGLQGQPAIGALADGGWVIVWHAPGTGFDILGQRYDVNGDRVGGAFTINSYTNGSQMNAEIAATPDGGFIVTWTSSGQDGADGGVYAQRFDADGDPAGSEFRVSNITAYDERDPHIAVLADGSFVITWTSLEQFDADIHGRHFAADGTPLGNRFIVRSGPSLDELNWDPRVTALADGGFVISWRSELSSDEIYARRYDANAAALGAAFQVNALPGGSAPALAGLADGSFVIAWSGAQDGDSGSIQAQHFAGYFAATEQVALDLKGQITIGDTDAGSDIITVTLSVTEGVLNVDPGTSGVTVDDSDQQNIVLTGTLAEIQALLGSDPTSTVTYTYDDDYLPLATIELSVTIDDGFDTAADTVTIDLTPVNDAAELDLDYLTPGNDALATYISGDPATPIAYYATFDDDNTDWDGATLTIAITGATADDQLVIDESLTYDTSIVGNDIFYQGDLIGTFTGGTNGDPLVITFNADACACAVEEVVYAIAYSNSDATPASGTRDVTFTFVDGGGTANGGEDTAIATVALTVTQGPTPPVIDAGAAASGDEDVAFALTGVTITDDGDPVTGLITVHLSVEHGTLTIRTDVSGGIDSSNIVGGDSGRTITIIGTPDEINATLAAANGLTYLGDADFNGADELTVTANDGTPASPLAISSLGSQSSFDFPSALALPDLNNDGFADLLLGLGDGTDPGIVLNISNSSVFNLPSGAAEAFAFGDFDGDGEADIAVASYAEDGSGYVGYCSSDTGDFEVISALPYALDLTAGDFNADGLMDLAVANSDGGNIAILLQTAPGVFAPPVYSLTTSLLTVSIRTGDFNDDGVLDLLVSNYGDVTSFAPPGSVDLFLGNGDGSLAAATTVWTGVSNADHLVVGDFNGDGFDDFAFASVDEAGVPGGINGVQVVLGNGDGTFGTATGYVTTATGRPHDIQVGDLNGDGILDLVVTNMDAPGTISILVGNGDGSFQTPVDFDTGDEPYVVALGDFEGDGDLDLVAAAAGDRVFDLFSNDSISRGGSATTTITVNSVNDAPSGTDATLTLDEDDSYTFAAADFGFSDSDGDDLLSVTITTLATAGTLYYDADGAGAGTAVAVTLGQVISAADIADGKLSFTPAANGNGAGYASFTFQVQDDGGAANSGVDLDQSANTITFDVTASNDSPAGGVTVVGSALVNQVLTANISALADADGLGTLHYQWQRDNGGVFTNVGSDQATYTLSAGDAGARMRVIITYTDGGATAESVTSTESAVVTARRATQIVTDTLDNKPWALQMTEFDSGDSILAQTVVLDTGRTWVNTYDTRNTSSVLWSTTNYAPGGAVVQKTVTYDDGTHTLMMNDVGNAYAWTQAVITFTADWQIVSVTGTRDAGGSVTSFTEIAEAFDTLAWYATPFDINSDAFANYGTFPTDMSLLGGVNADVLYGFAGSDTLNGMAGGDLIVGGRGNDVLTGGTGDDRFSFRSGDGFDTITDFTAGNSSGDVIDLHGYGIADFAALLARMTQMGADTVIALDEENQITLQQVTLGDLNASDFVFS